jgi:hypothetical protein
VGVTRMSFLRGMLVHGSASVASLDSWWIVPLDRIEQRDKRSGLEG